MDLSLHEGHKMEITRYGSELELECLTCRVTVKTQKTTIKRQTDPEPAPALVCSMEDGCLSCGS